jgi:hypothetical protein
MKNSEENWHNQSQTSSSHIARNVTIGQMTNRSNEKSRHEIFSIDEEDNIAHISLRSEEKPQK